MLEPILKETFGIITYQEQVQQIARDMAGYTLAEADLLRRAMGKKIKSEMDAQRERFMTGATERGINASLASTVFDACAKFAEYGFNKSHSAPYALITYQTAYMKANYPVEFMAASLTLETGNTDKIAEFRREAIRLGIPVDAPSVNRSGLEFEPEFDADGKGRILYSLAAIKGVGAQAIEHLVAVRGDAPFRDVADFGRRINPKIINKRTLESLIAAGALDELEPDRARLFAGVERILGLAAHIQENAAIGQGDMFGAVEARQPLLPAGGRAVAPGGKASEGTGGGRLLPLRPSARRIPHRAREHARAAVGGFFAVRARPAPRPDASPRPLPRGRSGARAPATRWRSSSSPIPPARSRRSRSRRSWRNIASCSSPAARSSCWSLPRSGRKASACASSRSSRSTR